MRLGKCPARHDRRTLRLSAYTQALPPSPAAIDWSAKVSNLGDMQNNVLGNCTIAAIGHIIQTWTANLLYQVIIPDPAIVAFYSASCGYVPGQPNTDQGGIELDVLNYWRKNPLNGHSLDAYTSIPATSRVDMQTSIWLFGAAYIGVQLPNVAQDQTVWDVPPDGPVGAGAPGSWGGHAVPLIAYGALGATCVTWGALKRVTWAFLATYCDEAYSLLSKDWASATGAPSGFNWSQLDADLAALK